MSLYVPNFWAKMLQKRNSCIVCTISGSDDGMLDFNSVTLISKYQYYVAEETNQYKQQQYCVLPETARTRALHLITEHFFPALPPFGQLTQ